MTNTQYDAYGVVTADLTVSLGTPYTSADWVGYKGQFGYFSDLEAGLIYCHARYYSPTMARWLTRDPIGMEGGLNPYSYCGGNPVMGVDPSGLEWTLFGFEFSVEVWKNGTDTGSAAVLHVFSFGNYTNKWAEQQPGY